MTLALPLPACDFAHVLARTHFEVFLEIGFHHLNPADMLSRAWYLSAMAAALEDVERGDCTRLIITVPPRHLKSMTTSVLFCAWVFGRDPAARIICASYGQDLSAVHTRNFRKVIRSAWYKQIFPRAAASIVRDTDQETTTRQNGFRYATALGGTVTGIGADYIIIDDLMKAGDVVHAEARERARRFIDETLLSRFDDKKTGRLISIQQRLHEDDCVAHLLQKGGFRHLNLPAIAEVDEIIPLTRGRTHSRRIGDVLDPKREPRDVLDRMKAEMTARIFSAQYRQNPTPADGAHIDWSKVSFYDEDWEREDFYEVVISWDTASSATGDYSVGTVWGFRDKSWWLLDVIRERLDYPALLARVRYERRRWRADLIIVEDAGVGIALIADLTQDMRCIGPRQNHAPGCRRLAIKPIASKEERFLAQIERLYSGLAKLPREADFLDDLRKELQAFPGGRHDDQVDSISQFLNWASGPRVRAQHGEPSLRRYTARERPPRRRY